MSLAIAGEAKIAAAASLSFALEEIADQFQQETGHTLKISFTSSGTLTRQIEQGAPFELFLSADETYIERLTQQSLTHDNGQVYAYGQLAIFKPNKQKSSIDLSLLKDSLEKESIKHFSIPNPELAPYGKIAKQALERSGLWNNISPFLILGENASQTAMFVSTGSVDGALLPHSLAIILHTRGKGDFQLLSNTLYETLNQRMVLLNNAGKVAQDFYIYLLQPPAQKTFNQHGFGSVIPKFRKN